MGRVEEGRETAKAESKNSRSSRETMPTSSQRAIIASVRVEETSSPSEDIQLSREKGFVVREAETGDGATDAAAELGSSSAFTMKLLPVCTTTGAKRGKSVVLSVLKGLEAFERQTVETVERE